ncbi:MAG TPA: hypothetical protein VEH58_07020 [Dehalococcoidales bacterium]|nr:hypothetical protein [Dehalococcoidales bacterium]
MESKVSFNEIAWAAFCFYYRSVADKKYCKIMCDTEFMDKLRYYPGTISPSEFEQKILLDHVNISSYDLLLGHKLADGLLTKIVALQQDLRTLQNITLLDCNFSNERITNSIKRIYSDLATVPGLWITGVSKIAHLLQPDLLVLLNLNISTHFNLLAGSTGLIEWFKILQTTALQVKMDFQEKGFPGTPELYISERLGYVKNGCHKSLVKYLDELYWLRYVDGVEIPPQWTPAQDLIPIFVTR